MKSRTREFTEKLRVGALVTTGRWRKFSILYLILAATAATMTGRTEQTPTPVVSFTTLVNFDGTNGQNPAYVSLAQGLDGSLYGTTEFGGANSSGTVFKVTTAGALSPLFNFECTGACAEQPLAGLLPDPNGAFYGVSQSGPIDYGTVFSVRPGGVLSILHSFDGTDGSYPSAALVRGPHGDLYGTTATGGVAGTSGTIFRITPSGALTVLHSFVETEGWFLYAGLVLGADDNFYGVAYSGGAYGYGTVFKITPLGAVSVLHSFNGIDGWYPYAALVEGTDGSFYGTTSGGGAYGNGTVFKITRGGAFSTLHDFLANEGSASVAPLIQATDGNLYGTTSFGGGSEDGAIFEITTSGSLTSLHTFAGADGANPYGGLVQHTNGDLYGVTYRGGASDDGTVFALDVGLGPFVDVLPSSGRVETPVKILGTGLTGATSVTFNGTAATFNVISGTLISATVPAGATTGFVTVTTPGGTLKSNVKFRVTQ